MIHAFIILYNPYFNTLRIETAYDLEDGLYENLIWLGYEIIGEV